MRVRNPTRVDFPSAMRSLVHERRITGQSECFLGTVAYRMRRSTRFLLVGVSLTLAACQPPADPVLAPPKPVPHEAILVAPTEPDVEVVATPSPAATVPESEKPAVVLPDAPELTPAGHALILEFETGGQSGYDQHPEWPGGASGITIGVGYDLGYYSRTVINLDWHEIQPNPRARLSSVAGLSGSRARSVLATVRDISVQWPIAVDVFDNVDVAREFASAEHAMPGFDDLRANAQAAIISVGFNRGWSFSGPNRVEWREIRDLVPSRDYEGISLQLRKMVRVWRGTSIEAGMTRRRYAEAALVLTP